MLFRSVQVAVALTAALLAPVFAHDVANDANSSPTRHDEYKIMEGHQVREKYHSPLPFTYIDEDDLPDNFNWGNVNGRSYLTHSLNRTLKKMMQRCKHRNLRCVCICALTDQSHCHCHCHYLLFTTSRAHPSVLWLMLGSRFP